MHAELARICGSDRVRANAPLGAWTTFRVGGPAEFLVDVASEAALLDVVAAARSAGAPVTMLGGGSNTLVADAGVRGVVIRLRLTEAAAVAPTIVRAGAGLTMNGLVRWTIGRGLAALEAWAGTPGTVGGAIYGNAHYGGRNISDVVSQVHVLSSDGRLETVPAAAMEFAYDTSRLQRTKEIAVWAEFHVAPGADVDVLRAAARASLAHRKRTQPLDIPSAGCIFQNPDPARDRVPAGIPPSAGALVDRAGLKGLRIGGAAISTTHGNFIVNDAGATAADIAALIDAARTAVREQFGVVLREEVVRMGRFSSDG